MSRTLTAEVNDELIRVPNRHDGCRRTQLATMLRMSAEMRMRGGLTLAVEVASAATARYLRREIAELHGISAAATVLGRNRYEVRVAQGSADLAIETGLIDSRGNEALGLPIAVVGGTLSEVAAAWRGAFLMAGSLTGPGRDAALTVSCPSPETAHALASLARRLGVLALVRENRERDHVLIRDADSIVTLLLKMGLNDAVLEWQRRGVRQQNSNLSSANATRTADAATETCSKVEWALALLGDSAPENLAETGKLRLAHRCASLEELGRYANPPMTKDSVAGRLRRLLEMADKVAAETGAPEPTTVSVANLVSV